MFKKVEFSRRTSYSGRNNVCHCIGMAVERFEAAHSTDQDVVSLYPINSLGAVGRGCVIEIPTEDVGAVIAALQEVKPCR